METIDQNAYEEYIASIYPVEFRPDLNQPPIIPNGTELEAYLDNRARELDFCTDVAYSELVDREWESIHAEVEAQSNNGFVKGVEQWRFRVIDFLEGGALYQATMLSHPTLIGEYLDADMSEKHRWERILFLKCGFVPGYKPEDYEKMRKETMGKNTIKSWES